MKINKYYKREISRHSIDFDNGTVSYTFEATYRSLIYRYIIDSSKLEDYHKLAIDRFEDGTHHLFIVLDQEDNFVTFTTSKRITLKGKPINKFTPKEYDPIDYINYYQYNIFTQLDGITTIVGMSGAGKTYSALSMLSLYAGHFDKIAYLNYELSERDIWKRFKNMFPQPEAQARVAAKLYMKEGIMSSLDLEEIMQAMDIMKGEKVVFIVDNVGSVIGQEDNVYHKQNEFLKHLDVICKERGFHALALTQTVKDHNANFFDENGQIKGSVNMSIMSGSIMLGNLSRTVLFTGYNGETESFKVKVLKKGTGILYSEEGVDRDSNFIKR